MKGFKIRLSRKLLLIIGSVTILGGGSGVAAVYIGADRLLGPSYSSLNGLECTTVATVKIKKADRYWIRKYVTTNEPGDGMSRLKTALRVARTVQAAEHSDLVQVTVLDAAGPTERSKMRGRAIGAQVVYIPDLAKAPEGSPAQPIKAYYVDGMANDTGDFWGLRIDLPLEDAEYLSTKLTDSADCLEPLVEGEGAPGAAAGHGKAKGDEKAADHGKGEDGGGEEHGAEPAAEDHGEETPVAEHEGGEKTGWMASLMGMVGLGGGEGEAHEAAPEAGHEPPAEDALTAGHGAESEKDTTAHAPAADAAAHETKPPAEGVAAHPTEETAPVEDEGWFTAVKTMVGLGETAEEATADQVTPAHEDVPVAAEAAHAEPMAEAPAADAPPAKADEHGAAWLAKMRAQPLAPAADSPAAASGSEEGHPPAGGDDHSAIKTPADGDSVQHAEASHAPVVAEEDDPEKHRRKPDASAATH
ncbi:MAG: hypothetical protein ACK4N1_12580 [Pseudorhizobium sp.]